MSEFIDTPRALDSADGSPTKKCSHCGEVKPWTEFRVGAKRNGVSFPIAFCKACGTKRVQDWRRDHPERYTALVSGTREKRHERKVAQLGGREPHRCEICGTLFVGAHHEGAHYDHNHDTGDGRGWLCNRCNAGLGALGDNPKLIERALAYLNERGFAPNRPVFR